MTCSRFVSDAEGTLNSMRQFVANARNANPNIQLLLANVPQRSFIGGRQDLVDKTTQYNNEFPAAVQALDQTNSPARVVEFAGNYNCQPSGCPSGYDGKKDSPNFARFMCFGDVMRRLEEHLCSRDHMLTQVLPRSTS